MIILLSLVCALQACLTLWLYRKVTCMQAGILIANLGAVRRAEVVGLALAVLRLKADVKKWKIRVASVSARLDAKARNNIQTKMVVMHSIKEEMDAYRKWTDAHPNFIGPPEEPRYDDEQEWHDDDPGLDEQYQDPDPLDEDPYDGVPADTGKVPDNSSFANPKRKKGWKYSG